MKFDSDSVTTIAIVAFALAYIVISSDYAPGARLIPTIVAVTTIVIGALQLFGSRVPGLNVLVRESESEEGKGKNLLSHPMYRGRTLHVMTWTVGFFLLIYLLGFVVAVPIFMLAFLGFVDRRSWLLTISLTLVLTLLTSFLIMGLLELPWKEGVILRMLR